MPEITLPSRSSQGVKHITEKLERSSLDDRSYRVIQLPNQLEALLIHDPTTDKASAALDVNVGSFSDDERLPGMAHAVEHLLFMGTEKYPKENAYSQYLSANSGYSNAYTAATSTNYYFEVAATAAEPSVKDVAEKTPSEAENPVASNESPLYGALDRFAQFFIAPLFLKDTLEREMKAVDSENKKNLQSDSWRLYQLKKSVANPDHPHHKFSTGNYDTLLKDPEAKGIDVRAEFMKFHQENYSANRMKLVILGQESLDTLEKWASEMFGSIKNKDLPKKTWALPVLTPKELSTITTAKPVMEQRRLEIEFPWTDEEDSFECPSSRYFSHLIGHEGPGSILAYLKEQGWASALSCGGSQLCPGSNLFEITIALTPKGFEKYEDVLKVLFEYISLLRETPPQEWIVKEMQLLNEIQFRFKQKSRPESTTSKLSERMQRSIPREWLLNSSSTRSFDSSAIAAGVEQLRVNNFRVQLVSHDLTGLKLKEHWYGTEYNFEKLPSNLLEDLEKAASKTPATRLKELYLPPPNEFIPENLSVEKKEGITPAIAPTLLRNDRQSRIWWKRDDRFWVPKTNLFISLNSYINNASPSNHVKASIYNELVEDELTEYSYDAGLAGLSYSLGLNSRSIDLQLGGYNDKMSVLLEKVLRTMRTLKVRPERFDIIKEQLGRGYKNYGLMSPYSQIGNDASLLMSVQGYTVPELRDALVDITPQDIEAFYPNLLKEVQIEMFAHGNLDKAETLKFADIVQSIVHPKLLPVSMVKPSRNLLPFPGSNYEFNRELGDPKNVNHCTEYSLFMGLVSDRKLTADLSMLTQILEEPTFDQLRTKEQLGYIVFSGPRCSATTQSYRILVQSERTPEYIQSRIEEFLKAQYNAIRKMSDKDFEDHKRSLITKRLEKDKNLGEESGRLWSEIDSSYLDFEEKEILAADIRKVTKEDVLALYRAKVHPLSQTRSKLSINLRAQATAAEVAKDVSPDQRREALVTAFSGFLAQGGITADAAGLESEFASADTDSKQGCLAAIEAYFAKHPIGDASATQALMAQLSPALDAVLPSPGIMTAQAAPPAVDEAATDLAPPEGWDGYTQPAVVQIEDVFAYKLGLPASTGPIPFNPLSKYLESGGEAKGGEKA